jgi:hypothetical protein
LLAQTRVVDGTVVNAREQPCPSSLVSAWEVSERNTAGSIPWVKTDKDGHFRLLLLPGHYTIRAKNPQELYPDPSILFSYDPSATFPDVELRNSDIHGVVVRLGSRGALLRGDVQTESGEPIPRSTVTIRDFRNPKLYVLLTTNDDGRFEFVTPAKPLLVEATGEGFSITPYNDKKPITPSSGGSLVIHIQLHRSP